MQKKKKRTLVWVIVLVVLAAIATFITINIKRAGELAQTMLSSIQEYTVERGTIESTITASGALEAADTQTLELIDGLEFSEIYAKAGDEVKAGDVLALLDVDSVREQVAYLSRETASQDNYLRKSGTLDDIGAPCTGRVKYLPVEEGDDVLEAMRDYGVLALLSTDGKMRLTIETDAELTMGQRLTVRWDGGSARGTVDRAAPGGYVILVPDQHAPYQASATVLDGERELGSGMLEINMPVGVYGYDGVIKQIGYRLDESVPDGRTMFTLDNAPATVSFEARYAERERVAARYQAAIQYLADPRVLAPCDGIVSEVAVSVDARSGNADKADKQSVAFTFATGGAVKLTADIDELDIANVALNQQVRVSFDSFESEEFSGVVTRINHIGKRQNSIASYAVEITLDADERLRIGMNGTATILVARVEDVLVIPVAAINEDAQGAYVNLLGADGAGVRADVETGYSDGDMAQVKAGLKEGDVISYAADTGLSLADLYGGAMGVSTVTVTEEG